MYIHDCASIHTNATLCALSNLIDLMFLKHIQQITNLGLSKEVSYGLISEYIKIKNIN